MFRRRDPDARLDDLAALIDARTATDLHRALVLGPPAAYEREVSMPLSYFRSAHDHDPTRAAETAMLLGTDPRWSVVAGPLLEAIEATGIVPPDHLDVLAQAFIGADATVYWKCPDDWFSTIGIIVSESDAPPWSLDSDRDDDPDDEPDDSDEQGPTVAARVVAPGLRRWGAARTVRSDPSTWSPICARSKELDAPGGGGVMRGLLDSIDALPLAAQSLVRREALKSGRSDVRQAALRQIAELDWSLARTYGLRDANEQLRRWASALAEPSKASSPVVGQTSDRGSTASKSKKGASGQVSLFD